MDKIKFYSKKIERNGFEQLDKRVTTDRKKKQMFRCWKNLEKTCAKS